MQDLTLSQMGLNVEDEDDDDDDEDEEGEDVANEDEDDEDDEDVVSQGNGGMPLPVPVRDSKYYVPYSLSTWVIRLIINVVSKNHGTRTFPPPAS